MEMQKFISVKITEGCEMTAGEFNSRNPEGNCKNRDPEEDGYMIKYLEGDGYESWCPKDIHESRNFPMNGSDGTTVSQHMVSHFIGEKKVSKVDDKTSMVIAETLTGFRQYEVSSCIDPKNFDMDIGEKIATKKIEDTLWQCLGFLVQWGRFGLKRGADV